MQIESSGPPNRGAGPKTATVSDKREFRNAPSDSILTRKEGRQPAVSTHRTAAKVASSVLRQLGVA